MVQSSPPSAGRIQVQPQVRELESHMPQNMKQKQYCNIFSKGLKKIRIPGSLGVLIYEMEIRQDLPVVLLSELKDALRTG